MSGFAAVSPQQPQTLLTAFAYPGIGGSTAVAVDPTTQALWFGLQSTDTTALQVTITGVTTGIVYFSGKVSGKDWALCPVSPSVDPVLSVAVVGIATPGTLYVVARQDPIVSYLAGVQSGAEQNRFQPVIPTPGQNQFLTSASATGATVALLPAPPAGGQAYLIWAFALWAFHSTATSVALARIQTATGPIQIVGGNGVGGFNIALCPPVGVKINDAISLVSATNVTAVGSLIYSLVPA